MLNDLMDDFDIVCTLTKIGAWIIFYIYLYVVTLLYIICVIINIYILYNLYYLNIIYIK